MNHNHHMDCKHEDVRYCEKCRLVYCKNCDKEWKEQSGWTYATCDPLTIGTQINGNIGLGTTKPLNY